jgi:heat shock protein HslJ
MQIKKYTSIAILLALLLVVAVLIQYTNKYIGNTDIAGGPTGQAPITNEDHSQDSIDRITSNVWIWSETYYGTGPDMEGLSPVKPKKEGVFTLTFKKDGTFSGTTDCNGFGGNYTLDGMTIEFSSIMSTMMYCEGSQESEYLKMFDHAGLNWEEDRFILMNDKTIIFKKGAEIVSE